MDKDLQITQDEITNLDKIAKDIVLYSEDDRQKANDLYKYYQELIDAGDSKGDTRIALAKSLELRETSVNNLIEILKLKTHLIERKIALEMKRTGEGPESSFFSGKRAGFNSSDVIKNMEEDDE